MTGEFPTQMASNADNVSIWWRHHVADNGSTASTVGIPGRICCCDMTTFITASYVKITVDKHHCLKHSGQDKMPANLRTTFSYYFSCMEMMIFNQTNSELYYKTPTTPIPYRDQHSAAPMSQFLKEVIDTGFHALNVLFRVNNLFESSRMCTKYTNEMTSGKPAYVCTAVCRLDSI